MTEKKKFWIRRAFGMLWTAIVTLYRIVVVVFVLLLVIGVWSMLRGGAPAIVEDDVALVIWPTGELVDEVDIDPSTAFLEEFSGEMPSQTLLRDLTDALDEAATDSRISLAVLKLDDMQSAGMAQMQELSAAMDRFRDSGKPIYVYGGYFDQVGYYAAAHADHVILDPEGMVGIEGFSSYGTYFKDALDKLGVKVNVFRVGEYKSAVEPFLRNDMSEDARKANLDWLGDLWSIYAQGVDQARGLSEGAARGYVDGFVDHLVESGGDAAKVALDAGLVTKVGTLEDFRREVGDIVDFDDDHGSFRQIHHRDYLRAVAHGHGPAPSSDKEVALVVARGEIVDGNGDVGQVGGDRLSSMLAELRRDDNVRAVVLRVDSPGGSTWASEQIRRQVQLLRAEGKPVVASMGNVAASGGYWISMDADQIWAHDVTITGSIGIFGLIPTIDESLGKLGIHSDGVGTTPLAGALRIDRPMGEPAKAMIQSLIDRGYRQFIEGVAHGRNLPVERVDEIARGRVWSGADALELGLVDNIGGLPEALEAAAQLAGIPEGEWSLRDVRPDDESPLGFLTRFSGSGLMGAIPLPESLVTRIGAYLHRQSALDGLPALMDPHGAYAYCFCAPDLGSPVGLH